jgi:hypothetical protein
MKYIVFIVFAFIVHLLCLPIWIITWDWNGRTNGWYDIIDGIGKMCDVETD